MCGTGRGKRQELRDPEGIIMETAQSNGHRAHDTCSVAERAGANLHRPRRKL